MKNMDLSVCTYTEYDDDGELGIQCDAYAEEGGLTPFYSIQPLGLHARPADPSGDKGALCLSWNEGAEGFCMPLGDQRVDGPLPNLTKGATCVHDTKTGRHRITFDDQNKIVHVEVPSGSTFKVTVGSVVFEITPAGEIKLGVGTAAAVQCGGVEPLAKFAALNTALQAVASALTTIAAQPYVGGAIPAATNAVSSIQSFAASGSTLVTKGA